MAQPRKAAFASKYHKESDHAVDWSRVSSLVSTKDIIERARRETNKLPQVEDIYDDSAVT